MNLLPKTAWFSRFVTFGLALVAGGGVAYWALQWSGSTSVGALLVTDSQSLALAETAAVARALGGAGAVSPVAQSDKGSALSASRFSLVGVVAVGTSAGAALISVDGAKPRPFALGAKVGDVWVLHSVRTRQAVLVRPASGDGKPAVGDAGLVLQMPLLAETK